MTALRILRALPGCTSATHSASEVMIAIAKRAVFAIGMVVLSAGVAQAGVLTTLNFGNDQVDSGRGLPPPDPGVYCPGPDDIPCFKDKSETFTSHGAIERVSLTATLQFFGGELSLALKHDGVTVGLVFMFSHSLLDSRPATVTFDDLAADPLPLFPLVSGTFRPDSPLRAFNGLDASGDWT